VIGSIGGSGTGIRHRISMADVKAGGGLHEGIQRDRCGGALTALRLAAAMKSEVSAAPTEPDTDLNDSSDSAHGDDFPPPMATDASADRIVARLIEEATLAD